MSQMQSTRASNRNVLLDAVESILAEGCAADVTLESVAARAGVTKGGLVYHFKSREALFYAVVERMSEGRKTPERDPALSPDEQLHDLLTHRIHAALNLDPLQKKILGNLVAASTTYPKLMPLVWGLYEDGFDSLAAYSKATGTALAIRSALDGILLLQLLSIREFTSEEKDLLRSTLLELADQQLSTSHSPPNANSNP